MALRKKNQINPRILGFFGVLWILARFFTKKQYNTVFFVYVCHIFHSKYPNCGLWIQILVHKFVADFWIRTAIPNL